MSAYIVDNETINDIVSFLYFDAWTNSGPTFGELAKRLKSIGYDLTREECQDALAYEMFDMNREAVIYRYDQETVDDTWPIEYEWQFNSQPRNMVETYKALQCWLYQCLEGDVPNHTLYKTMQKVQEDMAYMIISSLPEYKKAAWG